MDKLPDLGLPFFYRLALPGVIVGGLLTPLLLRAIRDFGLAVEQQVVVVTTFLIVVGFVLSSASEPIYWLYEGRRFWFGPLKRWRIRAWRQRVAALLAQTTRPDISGADYNELWFRLRQFPTTDGKVAVTATAPTRLGNILEAYESYPDWRYGMDSVFYWSRLWLTLDKDARADIDAGWAPADGFLYVACGMWVSGLTYLGIAGLAWLGSVGGIVWSQFPSADVRTLLIIGIALIPLSFLPYALSIPLQWSNGQVYMSVFDLNATKLNDLGPATEEERARRDAVVQALQYGAALEPQAEKPAMDLPLDTDLVLVVKKPVS